MYFIKLLAYAVTNWPTSKPVTVVIQFLGLSIFYRRFICTCTAITEKITDFNRKKIWEWVNNLKLLLPLAPIPTHP